MPQLGVPAHMLMGGGKKWLKESNKKRARGYEELIWEMPEANTICG